MDTLMRTQNGYDIAQARQRANDIKVAPFKTRWRIDLLSHDENIAFGSAKPSGSL
jgi:hypothetical protein